MFFKKKKIEIQPTLLRQNVFNIPSDEAKKYLSSIIQDVNTIMQNDKFMEATKKVKLPENATVKDYENLLKRVAPNKIYNFLSLFVDECFDEVRRILSAIFVTEYELYKKKSLSEMCEDIASLNKEELRKILSFFIR